MAEVRRCRVCGCTDTQACAGGCWWVGRDLCSACQLAPPARVERPILFSGPMVRAILEGRKTQTIRPITRLHGFGQVHDFQRADTPGYDWAFRDRGGRWNEVDDTRLRQQFCPFGVAGDQLWVRETFKDVASGAIKNGTGEIRYGTAYAADAAVIWKPKPTVVHDLRGFDTGPAQFEKRPWRPSIHMPRCASRILLEITDVRAQRLHDLSEADAIAEGCRWVGTDKGRDFYAARYPEPGVKTEVFNPSGANTAREAFAALWDSINGTGAWNTNPWVWVITFRRTSP